MPEKNRGFINVDELVPQVTVEQVATYYGVATAGSLSRR